MNPLPSGFAQVKKRSALVLPAVRLDVRETPMQVFVRLELLPKKWQVSPLLLYSLPWHRARTELSRKVSCQSAYCRATLFDGSREKCFAFRSRSVDGTEYVTQPLNARAHRLAPGFRVPWRQNPRDTGDKSPLRKERARPMDKRRRSGPGGRPMRHATFVADTVQLCLAPRS